MALLFPGIRLLVSDITNGCAFSCWTNLPYKDMNLKLRAAIFHYMKPNNKDNTAEKRMRGKESQDLDDIT